MFARPKLRTPAAGACVERALPAVVAGYRPLQVIGAKYGEPNAISNPVEYAKFSSRSHQAVVRVYDLAGNVIETYEHAGDFKEPLLTSTKKTPRAET
jgi:hypothetical protein